MRSLLPLATVLLALPLALSAQNAAPEPARAILAGFKPVPAVPGKVTPAPAPAKPVIAAPEHLADLEITGVEIRPLNADARIWSDRNVHITKFPDKFEGFKFTQSPAHGLTLKFKVVSNGTVVLGCGARWGTTAEPEVAKDFSTEKSLTDAGWVRQEYDEVETESSDMTFLLFTRECKAGEEFSLRTDKYAPPILLIKSEPLAKLEVPGVEIRPLAADARVWTDREVHITKFPGKFEGFKFTQSPAHGLTLKFKAISNGTVVLGCSSRWGTTADPETAKEFATQKTLMEAGWVRQQNDEIETSASDMTFLLFTRECKAGEEFTFRTDKYAPPILIFK